VEHSPTGHLTSLAATFALSWERLTKDDELAKRLFKIGGYCAPNIPIPRQILAKAMGAGITDHELDRALRKLDSLGLMDPSKGGRRMHSLLPSSPAFRTETLKRASYRPWERQWSELLLKPWKAACLKI